MNFLDEVQLQVSSGNGGAGCVSFRREACVPRGGPDGGNGGRGGNVVFRISQAMNSLINYKYKRKLSAGHGQTGAGQNKSGSDGGTLFLEVPEGTQVRSESGEILADLVEDNTFTFLTGGRGGRGNAFFKSSVNQAPQYCQPGEKGGTEKIFLELKLIAQVGILGFPNVGKSTLIARLSDSRSKVANYPFTTLVPHLGVVRLDEEKSFVMADIPGILPGAHKGVGLGLRFFRHIERTKILVHMIDACSWSGREPEKDYKDILHELKSYDEKYRVPHPLSERPQIVVLNKVDILSSERVRELQEKFNDMGVEVIPISAVSGHGIKRLMFAIGERVFSEE